MAVVSRMTCKIGRLDMTSHENPLLWKKKRKIVYSDITGSGVVVHARYICCLKVIFILVTIENVAFFRAF